MSLFVRTLHRAAGRCPHFCRLVIHHTIPIAMTPPITSTATTTGETRLSEPPDAAGATGPLPSRDPGDAFLWAGSGSILIEPSHCPSRFG